MAPAASHFLLMWSESSGRPLGDKAFVSEFRMVSPELGASSEFRWAFWALNHVFDLFLSNKTTAAICKTKVSSIIAPTAGDWEIVLIKLSVMGGMPIKIIIK